MSVRGDGRRALVTGGAGFIGSHLVAGLVRAGFRVRVLDDLSAGLRENLAECGDGAELRVADVRDPDALAWGVDGADVVFHEAAVTSVPQSVADPLGSDRVNVEGTLRVLDAARAAGVRRVVFAASAAVYGNDPELPKSETLPPQPLSPYALQKYAGEVYCRLYHELHGLETVALRYFNVFGPRQRPDSPYASVIPLFLDACLKGQPPRIFGDGEQTRDFVFVEDVVRANLLAVDAPAAAGRVMNVATGKPTSLNQLLESIQGALGTRLAAVRGAPRVGDVRHSVADVSRARELLGYAPASDLGEGIGRLVAEELRTRGEKR